MTAPTKVVQHSQEQSPARVAAMEIHRRMTKAEDRIAAFCPPGMTPQAVIHSVIVALQNNPKLLDANPDSVVLSAITITQWGLQIGQTAYIIPYKGVATPVADYKGYIELMMATRLVKHVNAQVIREAELAANFEYIEGDRREIIHRPMWRDKTSPIVGAYCSIPTTAGGVIQKVMNVDEIEKIRAKSLAWKDGGSQNRDGGLPEWYAQKCPIRGAAKFAPKSARLQQAMQFENDSGDPSAEALDLMSGSPQAAIGAGNPIADGAPSYVKDPAGAPIAASQGYGGEDLGV